MISEPESRFDGLNFYHYVVEHDGKAHQCNTLSYASYLAEKFDSKIWDVVLERHIDPFIGVCGYCKKHRELHFVSGNRGSFPPKDDELGCEECGSVYRIIDILMETGAYKDKK